MTDYLEFALPEVIRIPMPSTPAGGALAMYLLIAGITYFVVKKGMEDGYFEQEMNFRSIEASITAIVWPFTFLLIYWRFQKLIELAQEVNELAEGIDSSVPDLQHIEKLNRRLREEEHIRDI